VEEEAARGGAGVDGICEALELNALLVKFADQVYEVLDAAAQPIQFPDDQRVAFTEWPLCSSPSENSRVTLAAVGFVALPNS